MLNIKQTMPVVCAVLYGVTLLVGAFTGGLWAITGIGGAILLYALASARLGRLPEVDLGFVLIAFGALTLMALNAIISTQPDVSWVHWVNLATIFLPLILLSSPVLAEQAWHKSLPTIWLAMLVVGVGLLGVELAGHSFFLKLYKGVNASATEYNRGMSYLVLMSMPVAAVLTARRQYKGLAVLVAALLLAVVFTESRASKVGLAIALPTISMAFFYPALVQRALGTGLLLVMGWPFYAQWLYTYCHDWVLRLPASWHHRVEIWDYLSYRITEHPLLGWGLGSSQYLDNMNPHGATYVFAVHPAPHPHNAIVQLWVELGIPGLLLGGVFAGYMLWQAGRLDAQHRPFAYGAWAASLALSLCAYNLWTDSFFAAFALIAFAFALINRRFV